ncbi:hypothetical protein OIB37_26760 [Streptomyces sp. NBC_00820]|uniref:hypothetical protein n=1 Tax=Streptomyces sp. NBC_00820 TaxID=2975842 RepID=UPI002ED60168|nr:hypothetical protein OIB37_26760 [Streptomyces sp. NBC_00820]
MKSASHALRAASLVLAGLVAAGCSTNEPKREFKVPQALCGTPVPADALSRLLPESGKRLTAQHTGSLTDGSALCDVKVDGDTVLMISSERIDAGDSARHILQSRLSIQQQKSAEDGSIAYADRAAVSLVKCRGADVEKEDISTLVKLLDPARKNESAVKSMIDGYTTSLKDQHPCRPTS